MKNTILRLLFKRLDINPLKIKNNEKKEITQKRKPSLPKYAATKNGYESVPIKRKKEILLLPSRIIFTKNKYIVTV